MPRLLSVLQRSQSLLFVLLAATACCPAASVQAMSSGGPGGKWPKSWPQELEPLRGQAWTWQHDFDLSYDIPFATREEFEAAWPHILKLAGKGASIKLTRGPQLRVRAGKTAGVSIHPPLKYVTEKPYSVTRILLVVDGEIVDLNRIALPADITIVDQRFQDEQHE